MERSAVIDGEYRYRLSRKWDTGRDLTVIMLNPSVADDTRDDPTIRRCIGFARRRGLAGLNVVNLFALRATDPAALRSHPDPVGPRNDEFIAEAAQDSLMVAAWGAHGFAVPRAAEVSAALAAAGVNLQAWGVTKAGHPGHPLYLPSDSVLLPWPSTCGPATT